jgi:hypothetical protein
MLTAYDYRDDFEVWCADAYIVKSSDMSELKGFIKNCSRVLEGNKERGGQENFSITQ